jgi:tRNA modification GTPase
MSVPGEITRVVELTPPGRGAVAVVLVEGPRAVERVDAAIHRADGRSLADFPVGRILMARWGSPAGEELVVCCRATDAVEIHCHGGAAAVAGIVSRLCDDGCKRESWQAWKRRSTPDPIRAAAQIALTNAPTVRTAAILLDQFEGALSLAIQQITAAIDANDWPAVIALLEELLARRPVGLHLTEPWRVVLAGRPNVGKSSLLNALVGFERAIVYDRPGTTRDVVTSITAIDGWPVLLADTAGLRDAVDEIEAAGVERATSAAAGADLVLLVDDTPAAEPIAAPNAVLSLRVLNKVDLHPSLGARDRERFDVCVSATHGTGIATLAAAIAAALVPTPPVAGTPVAFESAQYDLLLAAFDAARRHDPLAVNRCLQSLLG